MSDTTPEANDHGPAPVQMSPEQAAILGLTPTAPGLIAADQVKPEDIGTLSIEYRDGQPVIVVSGGSHVPAQVPVVDAQDQIRASYTIGQASRIREVTEETDLFNVMTYDIGGSWQQ
ncbi:hypothetical protein ACWCYZ_17475 [Streptomyces virginiae]